VKVDVFDRLDAVGEAAWDGLLARSAFPSPFLSWAWQSAWLGVLGGDRRLQLARAEDAGGDLVGLLPLGADEQGVFQIVGGVDVSDYLDVIALAGLEEEVWAALLQSRVVAPGVWDLHSIRAASPTARLLPGLARAYGLAVSVTVEERCPVIDLPGTWDQYLAGLSAKQRHELLRKRRRLDRERPGTVTAAHATPEAISAGLDAFLVLHRGSRIGKARFMDSRMEGFFRLAIRALAARGMARLWLLEHGDRALAAFICIEWPETVGLYNSGFDVEMAALSPGIVLLGEIIRDAIARGRRRFDFLRGEEPYKLGFGARLEDLCAIRVTR
jgi:CelD/BcsL family acetyltransferase involved in cellulose biosynthesis